MSDVKKDQVVTEEEEINDVPKHKVETLAVSGINEIYFEKVSILNDALEDLGFGKYHWIFYFTAGFGWFMDNFWLYAVSLISVPITREYAGVKIAYMSLGKYVGMIIGATGLPLLADFVGRKPCFDFTLFLASLSGLVLLGMPTYASIVFFCALIGLSCGGNQILDSLYYMEVMSKSKQGLLLLESIFWGVSQTICACVGYAFITNYTCTTEQSANGLCTYENNLGWRYSYWTFGGLTTVMAILRLLARVYESPKYYLVRGEDAKTVQVVQSIAKRCKRETWLTLEHFQEVDVKYNVQIDKKDLNKAIIDRYLDQFRNVGKLFSSRKMGITTVLLWLIWACCGMGFPLFSAFLPLYLQYRGADTGTSTLAKTYRNYAIQSVCSIPSSFIAAWMIDHKYIGRKGVGLLGGILTGLFMFLFTVAKNELGILGFNCCVSFINTFIYAAMYTYTPEVYPTKYRATGVAICGSLNRIFGLGGPLLGLFLDLSTGKPVFIAGALFMFAGVLFLLLPYETRGKATS